jgi:hypothetical protein
VEDERSWQTLRALECDLVQGYLLARPMPAEEMSRWLAEHFATFATQLRQNVDPAVRTSESRNPAPTRTPENGPAPLRRAGNGDLWPH